MTSTIRSTANDILNRVGVEVGLDPVNDPYSTTDKSYVQMRYLLNVAGEELCQAYEWGDLVEEHSIQTQATDSGDYDLPADFLYMINQTGWERAESVPLYGPLSAQDWQYLLGRDLVSHTIYASFRLKEGKFSIFPQPPPDGLDIHFEYIRRNWVLEAGTTDSFTDSVETGGDVPIFNRTLISRYLKVKWLEAKRFDSTRAQADLNQIFEQLTGRDKGSKILSAGRNARGYPYLNSWTSVPDTGFGV
jgi:hypothetical protein